MKKHILIVLATLGISGCASGQYYPHPINPTSGAIIGGAIGNALSTGNRGAATAVGAILGATIGADMQAHYPHPPHSYYYRQRHYYAPPVTYEYRTSMCRPATHCNMFYSPYEREACLRGIHDCRFQESQRLHNQSIDAYNYGRN